MAFADQKFSELCLGKKYYLELWFSWDQIDVPAIAALSSPLKTLSELCAYKVKVNSCEGKYSIQRMQWDCHISQKIDVPTPRLGVVLERYYANNPHDSPTTFSMSLTYVLVNERTGEIFWFKTDQWAIRPQTPHAPYSEIRVPLTPYSILEKTTTSQKEATIEVPIKPRRRLRF